MRLPTCFVCGVVLWDCPAIISTIPEEVGYGRADHMTDLHMHIRTILHSRATPLEKCMGKSVLVSFSRRHKQKVLHVVVELPERPRQAGSTH